METIEQDDSRRPDLKDGPLTNPDAEWFTHGSRFIHEGVRKADCAKSAEPGVLPLSHFHPRGQISCLDHSTPAKTERGLLTAKGTLYETLGQKF